MPGPCAFAASLILNADCCLLELAAWQRGGHVAHAGSALVHEGALAALGLFDVH